MLSADVRRPRFLVVGVLAMVSADDWKGVISTSSVDLAGELGSVSGSNIPVVWKVWCVVTPTSVRRMPVIVVVAVACSTMRVGDAGFT